MPSGDLVVPPCQLLGVLQAGCWAASCVEAAVLLVCILEGHSSPPVPGPPISSFLALAGSQPLARPAGGAWQRARAVWSVSCVGQVHRPSGLVWSDKPLCINAPHRSLLATIPPLSLRFPALGCSTCSSPAPCPFLSSCCNHGWQGTDPPVCTVRPCGLCRGGDRRCHRLLG